MALITVPDGAGGAEHAIEVHHEGAVQFASRLRKVAKARRKWAQREAIGCYRLYDADLPEYAAAIDIYRAGTDASAPFFVHVAEYKAPATVDETLAAERFQDMLAVIPAVLGVDPSSVFSKVRTRAKGGSQYADAGDRSGRLAHRMITEECGLRFEVDLGSYLDTGIFLDHRVTRAFVGSLADGKRFLNLFAYTGTATVHAAAGGAASTVTVDLSQTYLEWARRNMALNGFTGSAHCFERGDVLAWLDDARARGRRFDLIFVDPPTFSNSKAMGKRTWDVQRDHVRLLDAVSELLDEGGLAVFSCNLRGFKPDCDGLAALGVEMKDISEKTIPLDFERNPRIHRCYLVRKRPSG